MYRSKEQVLDALMKGYVTRHSARQQGMRYKSLNKPEHAAMFLEAVAAYDAHLAFMKLPRCPHCAGLL
jgi:hypothetical protein